MTSASAYFPASIAGFPAFFSANIGKGTEAGMERIEAGKLDGAWKPEG